MFYMLAALQSYPGPGSQYIASSTIQQARWHVTVCLPVVLCCGDAASDLQLPVTP